jgi:predicted acyl esterase
MERRGFLTKAGLAAGGLLGASAPASAARSVSATDVEISSWDGATVAATVFRPADERQHPAVLMTHGYGGTRADLAGRAERYAHNGYVTLAYDSRGFGDSGGVSGFDGPKEVADALVLVDRLADGTFDRRDGGTLAIGVLPSDNGPAIGMDGGSYGGGTQLNAAAARPAALPDGVTDDTFERFTLDRGGPIDAIVPRITWHDLLYAAAPNGVIKATWDSFILAAGAPSGYTRDGRPDAQGPDPRLYEYVAEAFATNEVPAEARAYFRARSAPKTDIENIDAPTLLFQGWPDNLLSPNQALWTFEGLRANGVETALALFPGGHDAAFPTEPAAAGGDYLDRLSLAWLDRHVKPGDSARAPAVPPVSYYVYQSERNPRADPWRTAGEFPPAAATRAALDLGAARPTDRTPLANSVAPTSGRGPTGSLFGSPGFDAAGTAVDFDFRATEPIEVVGRPRLRLPVEPVGGDVHLFAKLQHVADGRTAVINEQVTAMGASETGVLDVECIAIQRHLRAGERLRLTVSTTDNGYLSSRDAAGAVLRHSADDPASLSIPVVAGSEAPFAARGAL